jgi:hypothetical protein
MKPIKDNMKIENSENWLVYLIVGIFSVLFILISIVLKDTWPVVSPFLKEIGFAGIISLIVIFTVERYSRNRHAKAADDLVDRINKNLFHAIYNRYIPEEVFVEVEKCLMHNSIFRRGHEINYTIQNLEADVEDENGKKTVDCSRHVQCLAQSRYTLKNVTGGQITHHVQLVLERPIDPKWNDFCEIKEIKISGRALSKEEIDQYSQKTEAQLIFDYEISIPPNGQIEVTSESTLLKLKTDSEIWSSRLPSDGIKLTVSMPSKDISVNASAIHSEKLVKILDNPVTKSWELKHGMFPHQSVVFWWYSNT